MNANDLEHRQQSNMLIVTDKRTRHWVSILVGVPGNRKYVVSGDNGRILANTNVEVIARQSTYAYLEARRRGEAG